MRKILLLGNQPKSLKFTKEALTNQNIELHFQNFETSNDLVSIIQDKHLLLLDTENLDNEQLNGIYSILKKKEITRVPALAFIQQNNVRLRYRLIELGVDDYLLIPFDKLDLQIRVKNLLNYQTQRIGNGERFFPISNIKNDFQILTERLNDLGKDLSTFDEHQFIEKVLNCLKESLAVQNIFYFEVVDENKIVLNHSEPSYSKDINVQISITDLQPFLKTIRLKQKTILNQINQQNPFYTFIKAHFNLSVKAFASHPVIVDQRVHSLILAVYTDNRKFHDLESRKIESFAKLIELAVQKKKTTLLSKDSTQFIAEQNSFEFMSQILDQLKFGILVIDKENKIRYLNETCAELLAIPKRKVVNLPLADIIGSKNMQSVFSAKRKINSAFERPELELVRNDGQNVLIGYSIIDFQAQDEGGTGYILTLKDITYSKESQEEMRRMDRLASLGVMASGIAHEIRNPLAGIKAIAQTFEEEFSPEDPKNEFVKRIIKQVNRLDDMLKTLFSYAKPQKPNRQFHQIENVLQEVLTLLKQKLHKHSIKLSQTFAPDLPKLYIDNSQIQQVLFNLILNSIEAIENRGEIHINIEQVNKDFNLFQNKAFYNKITEHPFVLIKISDTGCGISKEDLKQIFNPFFTTKAFGTGLGLSIVYQIVQENHGVIYFESEVENGTDCYLFLPTFNSEEGENKEKSETKEQIV